MKAMLSQPMAGKTDEEIKETRERAIRELESRGYEIVNTLFTDEWYSKESMTERGSCSDSTMLPCKKFREYVSLPRCIFLQGVGGYQGLQDRA